MLCERSMSVRRRPRRFPQHRIWGGGNCTRGNRRTRDFCSMMRRPGALYRPLGARSGRAFVPVKENGMFSHIMVGSNDIARSKKFYDALFAAIGAAPGTEDTARGRLAYTHNG